MTRYVYIPEPIVLYDEDDQRIKAHARTADPREAQRCNTGACACPDEPAVSIYKWFVKNCCTVGVSVNPQNGQQTKIGPGKAFGDGDKAARAINHIKRALKLAEPGTYVGIEHADWTLWKKCCEEGEWMPGVSAQYLAFIEAVLDAKDTPPPIKVVDQPSAPPATAALAAPEASS